MKVIIAGGRDFIDWKLLESRVHYYLKNCIDLEIISGCCSTGSVTFIRADGTMVCGADGLGERYAKKYNLHVKYFPADWSKGKSAGPVRNKQMAEYGDALIAFHDGKSKGTSNMINEASDKGLKVKIVTYTK